MAPALVTRIKRIPGKSTCAECAQKLHRVFSHLVLSRRSLAGAQLRERQVRYAPPHCSLFVVARDHNLRFVRVADFLPDAFPVLGRTI